MDLKRLADRAKDLVEKRGGTGALEEDGRELKEIASSQASLTEKAKAAAEALQEPGAGETPERPASEPEPEAEPSALPEARTRRGRGKRRRRQLRP